MCRGRRGDSSGRDGVDNGGLWWPEKGSEVAAFTLKLKKRRRELRLNVCLCFWYRGEVNGDDEVVFRVAEGLPTVERERKTGLCNLERERRNRREREQCL